MSWAVAIPCGSKELAERVALQLESGAVQFKDFIHVIKEVSYDEASPFLIISAPSREDTIQSIVNAWPAEDQARLYRLLYNVGMRINR